MKELLARSNEALILDQVHDAVIVTNLQGTIHLWNSGAERIYGYSKSEIVGQPISRLYFPEDTGLLRAAVLGPLESQDLHEVMLRNRRKDGTEIFIDLRVSVVRNRVGKAIGYSGCSNDITPRRRAEEALASAYQDLERRVEERSRDLQAEIEERTRVAAQLQFSRERLRHIIVNAPGVLYTCSPDTFAATFVSDNIEQLFGYSSSELVSDPDFWDSRIHPEDRPHVLSAAAQINESDSFSHEYRSRRVDGSFRWVRDDATLIRDPGGKAIEIVGYMQDITEARHAEEGRRERERLELVAQHLLETQEGERKRLSRELHDNLNQQLASLVLDVSGLKSSLPESRKSIQRSLHELKKRIAGISDDVDRMARQLHPAALEQFGLGATLKSECTALSKRTGIRLTFRCQTPPRELSTEVQLCLYRLAQECLNNIGRHAKASRASVTLKGISKGICLAIKDSGVGFDPSVLPRERLGLRNMMERVRLLHGTFTVDSAIGRGTRIEARIPVTEARGAETSHTAG